MDPTEQTEKDEQYQKGWRDGSQSSHDARYPALEAEINGARAEIERLETRLNKAILDEDYFVEQLEKERQGAARLRERNAELEATVREHGDMLHSYMVQRDDLRSKLDNALKAGAARIKKLEAVEAERDIAEQALRDLMDRHQGDAA